MPPGTNPPILLPMAAYYGTLAAARCLGSSGIPVTLAEGGRLVPAVWSRHVARRVHTPGLEDPDRFMDWLFAFGEREPGHVLYPTSDDLAFLYARHRSELAKNFLIRHPPLEATWQLLNKTRLAALAEAVGLRMPRTWVPENEAAIDEVAREASFPVVVKPQSQALLRPHNKGIMVEHPAQLKDAYRQFAAETVHTRPVLEYDPQANRPTVQEYAPAASESVYGMSGFIDESGELVAMRASRKILQQPRHLGVGLCFEEAELIPDMEARVTALCRRAGHHGVFEAEFIEVGGKPLLIDFNPRFYGQMAFDIARGMPQALLAYHHTLGREDRLRQLVEAAAASRATRGLVYCRGFELQLFLLGRTLGGSMTWGEAAKWRGWLAEHRERLIDGVSSRGDRLPVWLQSLHHLSSLARHPRSYVRALTRN